MSSVLFDNLGLGYIDIGYILIGMAAVILLLFIFVIVLFFKVGKIKKQYKIFMTGKDAKSLEKEVVGLFEDVSFLKIASEKNKKEIRKLFHDMEYTYQKCGIVKYDAFKGMGGKLSFCLALLNERNDGFILNSVHSSDGCYSYTKEILDGKCDVELGKEEENALDIAMGEN